jgi:exodeoxyribonuclease VII large subunit
MYESMESVYTVSQINQYLKNLIDREDALKNITVQGEISNFTNHLKSGHFYFTIKDESCSLKAVMFRTYAQKVRFQVENGMKVLLTGDVRVFERDGVVQFYCEKMEPDGIGALALAFEQLKQKLGREGLFAPEHKKPIPAYPNRIGVVTSKTGAAWHDILNILSRRYPVGTVVLIPSLVQGEQAPDSICRGIELAQAYGNLDVLIVGRGGGSMEDLWCFNDEQVARAIYGCTVPVISAVGHEIDFTISDFVADLRAPTPSAAAELCAPDRLKMLQDLRQYEAFLHQNMKITYQRAAERFGLAAQKLAQYAPDKVLAAQSERLTELKRRLDLAQERLLKEKTQQYLTQVSMLEALNPLRVLSRGFCVTYRDGKAVTHIAQVQTGDLLQTRLCDGIIESTVVGLSETKKGVS